MQQTLMPGVLTSVFVGLSFLFLENIVMTAYKILMLNKSTAHVYSVFGYLGIDVIELNLIFFIDILKKHVI